MYSSLLLLIMSGTTFKFQSSRLIEMYDFISFYFLSCLFDSCDEAVLQKLWIVARMIDYINQIITYTACLVNIKINII